MTSGHTGARCWGTGECKCDVAARMSRGGGAGVVGSFATFSGSGGGSGISRSRDSKVVAIVYCFAVSSVTFFLFWKRWYKKRCYP